MKIKALGYIAIEAQTPEAWSHFLTEIVGFMPASSITHPQINYFKMDNYMWRIAVIPSKEDKLSIAGWEVSNKEDFDQATEELKAANVDVCVGGVVQLKPVFELIKSVLLARIVTRD